MQYLAWKMAKTTKFVCRYTACDRRRVLGARGGAARRARPRRYWARSLRAPPTDDAADAEARASAYRRALADDPLDEDLWLRYIDFQVLRPGLGPRLASPYCILFFRLHYKPIEIRSVRAS